MANEKDKKKTIVIKKKKGGGHAGAHGGGWKVAYADFMTAMMCFFLVMWLMASDDETKAAIAHYFNHPNTPWVQGRDPSSDQVRPLGERKGVGENILKGLDGLNPDDLVKDPVRSVSEIKENKELGELAAELLDNQAYAFDITLDYVRFSVPEELLFKGGSSELSPTAGKYLERLGQLFRGYRGYITIEGHSDNPPQTTGIFSNSYEYTLARAVSVMNYFIEHHWVAEERMMPIGSGGKKTITPNTTAEGRKKNRRVEFTLSYRKNI
ncbi:MAG TPA: flagellar motor protein MotB [Bdellovibrionota bacterium]|nr:flagellar motor protein MotB [Bdellovibrionota bacterium]